MSQKTQSKDPLEQIEGELIKGKSKQSKEKKMKTIARKETIKTWTIVVLLFLIGLASAYIFGRTHGYEDKKLFDAKVVAEAQKLAVSKHNPNR